MTNTTQINREIAGLDKEAALADFEDITFLVNDHNGWYEKPRELTADCMLIVGEAAEAHEEIRNGHGPNDVYFTHDKKCAEFSVEMTIEQASRVTCCIPKPEGFPTEIADVFIRVMDTVRRRNIDLAFEVRRKLTYNLTRGHMHGGKTE